MKSGIKVGIILGSVILILIIIIVVWYFVFFPFYDFYIKIREKNNLHKSLKFTGDPKVLYTVILGNKKERLKNVQDFGQQLKQSLEYWPAIYTKPCPTKLSNNLKRQQTVRGLLLAHKQIWERFKASSYDLLVIFEDDVNISSPNSIESMHQEFKNLRVDLLYLGYCTYPYHIVGPPWCTHAYALTKKGVQILLDNFNQCSSLAIDDYLRSFNKTIAWNVVAPPPHEKRHRFYKGLFHQQEYKSTLA